MVPVNRVLGIVEYQITGILLYILAGFCLFNTVHNILLCYKLFFSLNTSCLTEPLPEWTMVLLHLWVGLGCCSMSRGNESLGVENPQGGVLDLLHCTSPSLHWEE